MLSKNYAAKLLTIKGSMPIVVVEKKQDLTKDAASTMKDSVSKSGE